MATPTLETLKAQGKLAAWYDFRKGSLLDKSGNGYTLTSTDAPVWSRTQKGWGQYSKRGVSGYFGIAVANSPKLTIASPLIFMRFKQIIPASAASYGEFCSKGQAWGILRNTANVLSVFSFGGSAGFKPSTYTFTDQLDHVIAVRFKSGVTNGTQFYVDGAPFGSVTWTTGADSTLTIGTGLNGIVHNTGGVITSFIVCNDNTLTNEQIKTISQEIESEYTTSVPFSNFVFPTPEETDASCILHYDMHTKTSGGSMKDLTNNYLNGTVLGANTGQGVFSNAAQFNGSSNYISIPTLTSKISNTAGAISLWYKKTGTGSGRGIFAQHLTAYRPLIYTGDGTVTATWANATGMTVSSEYTTTAYASNNVFHHVVFTWGSNAYQFYVDGLLIDSATGCVFPSMASGTAYLGRYIDATHSFDGNIDNVKIYNSNLSSIQVGKLYNEASKYVRQDNCACSAPISLAAVTAGNLQGSEMRVESGAFKITEDSAGKKWFECTTSGLLTTPITFNGTAVRFTFTQGATGTQTLQFLANKRASYTDSGFNGYVANVSTSGQITIQRVASGAATTVFQSKDGVVTQGVAYTLGIVRITKSTNNNYVLLKRVTDDEYTQLQSIAGANPYSDTTYVTGKYIGYETTAGNKMSDLQLGLNGI